MRPFLIFAFLVFMCGFLPDKSLNDYRAPFAIMFLCAILTAFFEGFLKLGDRAQR